MGLYQLKVKQHIPATQNQLWEFISSPRNLSKITPESMSFSITNEPIASIMYPGMIICYKVSPFLGIKLTWVTEITHVSDGNYFVDEQRIGPYSMWHHEHHLTETKEGVLMEDIISYKPPFGLLGRLANWLFIRHQLQTIFNYRYQAMEKQFGASLPL
ncbi:MAG: SRPBCC family protein [Chitinophagaceae bacterium]|nr:SRPBCC family protein [Chitinophagaceae bacterium]